MPLFGQRKKAREGIGWYFDAAENMTNQLRARGPTMTWSEIARVHIACWEKVWNDYPVLRKAPPGEWPQTLPTMRIGLRTPLALVFLEHLCIALDSKLEWKDEFCGDYWALVLARMDVETFDEALREVAAESGTQIKSREDIAKEREHLTNEEAALGARVATIPPLGSISRWAEATWRYVRG